MQYFYMTPSTFRKYSIDVNIHYVINIDLVDIHVQMCDIETNLFCID
jgi:hypothetical protein